MKKIIPILLALCLLCACAPVPPPTPTEAPTETPASPDILLFGFEDGNTLFSQPDMSFWGINDALLSTNEENADTGKALQVRLDCDSTRFCQSLTTAPPAVFGENADSRAYLRLWVHNEADGNLSISVIFSNGANTGMLDASCATVTRCDGEIQDTVAVDASDAGSAGHVRLPAGFSGWVAFPLEQKLLGILQYPVLEDLSAATEFKLDIRHSNVTSSQYYMIDEITLTNEAKGVTRVYEDYISPTLSQVKADVETGLAAYLEVVPEVEYLPQYDPKSSATGENTWRNIRALTFDGANIGENKTKVFAYIGYPENASEKSPAVVLVHGGLGHPYAMWIKEWTDRGYVAIAFENTGYFPTELGKNIAGRDSDPHNYWEYGLAGDFMEDGYVNAPTNSAMMDSGSPADTQWMYHCVAQTILAHNILRNDPAVDPERIGITGISWGGVISSIAIGYDTRFAFAIPVYCTGYASQALGNMGDYFSSLAAQTVWGAENRFDLVDFPVLWLCWNNDSSSSIIAPSLSYLHTKENHEKTVLSIIHNMQHYHSAAWNQSINYRFADWAVQGGAGLTLLENQPAGRSFTVNFTAPEDAVSVSAKLYYITEEMTYSKKEGQSGPTMDQPWLTLDCAVSGNTVSCQVPADAYSYYLELTTVTSTGSYITTSAFIQAEP